MAVVGGATVAVSTATLAVVRMVVNKHQASRVPEVRFVDVNPSELP